MLNISNPKQIGFCFLGGGCGNLLGSFTGGKYLDYVLAKKAKARGGKIKPEDRYPVNVFFHGFCTLPFGTLLFGWSIHSKLSIALPIIGFGCVCFAMSQILLSGSTYLVDASGRGASATAAANCVRNTIACILSLVAAPMVQSIGVGYVGMLAI